MIKRTTTPVLCPGVLTEGTLDPMDLIPVFLDTLKAVDRPSWDVHHRTFLDGAHAQGRAFFETEDASWLLEDLAESLDERAQRVGLAFGPLESDPACWGFWLVMPEDE